MTITQITERHMSSDPTTEIVAVTPPLAADWLLRNTNNRPIRPSVLASYVRDMKAGRWQLTGEAIKFATDGTLLDGQHRLEAVVRSGVTVPMFVITGLSPDTRGVMDTGAKRKTADVLRMGGQRHSVALAAAGRIAIRFEQGTADSGGRGVVSNSEILSWIEATPGVHDAVDLSIKYRDYIEAPSGILIYAAWKLASIDAAAAQEFFDQVARLDGIASSDPRWVLSRRLYMMKRNKTVDTPAGYLDLFFQAWNRWREGKTATLFRVTRDERGRVVRLTEPR